MGIVINKDKITPEIAKQLVELCPFKAITYQDGKLEINSNCKACKMCVNKGPKGAMSYIEDKKSFTCNKEEYKGIAVYIELEGDHIHPVSLELIGKALSLAKVTNQPVYALLIGYNINKYLNELLVYGITTAYGYDHKALKNFLILPYANAFEDFINKIKPSSILVGATSLGRSLAPRIANRMHTGLTADCTSLEMKQNTDLVQIRPAFGGNIMAQIITPNTRPQFSTVRYKVFDKANKTTPIGKVVNLTMLESKYLTTTEVLKVIEKPKDLDISDADIIIAIGRGIKKIEDIKLIEDFAKLINAQIACSRPLVEAGFMDAKKQIGLSGRTVKAKLIITLGISGAVQFVAGMRSCSKIIAINKDKNAPIFDVAHYGIVGDLYELLPLIINKINQIKEKE